MAYQMPRLQVDNPHTSAGAASYAHGTQGESMCLDPYSILILIVVQVCDETAPAPLFKHLLHYVDHHANPSNRVMPYGLATYLPALRSSI